MNITKKILAGSAVAMMLLPFAASAHSDNGLKLGFLLGKGEVHANVNANLGHKEDNDNDKGKNEHKNSTATTTITAKANRITKVADFMASFSPVLATKIAGAGLNASSTATANAKLADYNSSLANAKVQANAAITAAASTTVARADLKAARGFLATAQRDFRIIVRLVLSI